MKKPGLDVLAFGEVLWDLFEDDTGDFLPRLGGAPANLVVHLARLGFRAGVLGGVGDDFLGARLRDELRQAGVALGPLVTKKERTGVVFIRRSKDGEPNFLFYREQSADMTISAKDVERVFSPPAVVHVSTSTLSRPLLAKATWELLAKADGKAFVVCDLNVRLRMWKSREHLRKATKKLLRHARLVKASEGDFRAMGFSSTKEGLRFLEKRVPIVLLTRGGGAAEVHREGKVIAKVAANKTKVVDATGAGDGFLAGFLAVLLRAKKVSGTKLTAGPEELLAALRFGHEIGSRVVGKIGSIEGTRDVSAMKKAFARTSC